MRIVALSDTHGQHANVKVPDGDVLIHCGDFTKGNMHDIHDILDFKVWLDKLPHKHKIVIAGNHDWYMEKYNHLGRLYLNSDSVHYLENSGVTIDGLDFWGSPYTPLFCSWAFMRRRGEGMADIWQHIPVSTDVLITHGPPAGILDINANDEHCGCYDLLKKVSNSKIKAHFFGHIHENYGILDTSGKVFCNCSVLDEYYHLVNSPITLELR
jgi:Icc-related predicted phosphoesterase